MSKFIMKIIVHKIFFITLLPLIILLSCSKTSEVDEADRTVIVYMIANNNLHDNAIQNINEMEESWGDYNGNLIVYISSREGTPYILEIKHDNSNLINSKIVKEYPAQNSCEISTMRSVYTDIMTMYPAKSYGTILWSHATGWLPSNTTFLYDQRSAIHDPGVPRLKSFGDEDGYKMEISDLAKALPDNLDFIIFDACLMANVESIYDLKDKANYIIASSTEILEMGFPYAKIAPYLCAPTIDLQKISEEYFNYYNAFTGISRSASISLINTAEIENLAQVCNQIIENNEPVSMLNFAAIQPLDTWSSTVFFDFADFMKNLYPEADLTNFYNQLDKVVIYKDNTPEFYNKFQIRTHCGLSCYIPNSASKSINNAYRQTAWSKASGLERLCID